MESTVATRWNEIRSRVKRAAERAGRDATQVQIVAVSKTFPAVKIAEAYRAGARIFGENYVQEALPKIKSLRSQQGLDDIEWHFIGALQSNKAKQVVGAFRLIHSLDRWSLASELNKVSQKTSQSVNALVEVNVAGEATKSGLPPEALPEFVRRISSETDLNVKGLMVFPPISDNPEASRRYFKRARELAESVRALGLPRIAMDELSMGVTNDFEVAVEEGSTLIRVGTAIFGPRG